MGNSANSADTAAAVLLAKNLAMALETGETLRPLLNNLIAKACELTGARYGAMGVLDLKKTGLADFITFGISEETARKIGHLPEGRGLLGAVIQSKGPIRVRRLSEDPRSSGFPPNHPPMVSFLGVPLRIGSEVFGNFYLTDKDSGAEFTAEDESLVENLGIQAALAVGYARHIDLLEAERKQTALRTLELNRLRDEFAAIVAHDLRNPVQAIASQVELILRKSNPGAVDIPVPRSTLNQIQSCGFRLGQMASDLLDAARVDVNRVALDRQESDPAKMLPEILNEIRSTLGGRKVSLRISAGIPKILLDRNRIAQILANLLENSDKYSTPGEPVALEASSSEGGLLISVTDHGPGIPQEDLPRLFDRFYQTHRARAKRTGLGLGLYITKGLVEAHGGKIWVESLPGIGSTFRLWFPLPASQEGKSNKAA